MMFLRIVFHFYKLPRRDRACPCPEYNPVQNTPVLGIGWYPHADIREVRPDVDIREGRPDTIATCWNNLG